MSFLQIHCHSSASLLDGTSKVKELVNKCIEYGMPGLTITDHGNFSNVFNAQQEAKKAGINFIHGCEYYVRLSEEQIKAQHELLKNINEEDAEEFIEESEDVEEDVEKKHKKSLQSLERKAFHQIVLIKNEEGWKNACKLNYYSFLKPTDKSFDRSKGGFYYSPRITRDHLFELKNGIIVTSSCMSSEINRYITQGNIEEAYKLTEQYKKNFGDDFYIELQINEVNNDEVSQKKINKNLIEIADSLNIRKVITGDVHYVDKATGAELQDIVIAMNRKTTIYDPNAFKLHARNLYFHDRKDYYEMNENFEYGYTKEFIDECLDNTLEINEKCNFEIVKKKSLPKYYDSAEDGKKKIRELCKEGLKNFIIKKNLDKDQQKVYIDRLKYELDVIEKNGYVDYFLIVWDMMEFCHKQKIQHGIGRGSVCSSLVSHLLGISGIDPIEYDLFFERFINVEALSEPDADLDFDSERRDEIIQYLKDKWGEDNVIRVGNFNTFNCRGCLKDLVRVLERSYEEIEFLCNDKKGNIDPKLTDETIDEWFEQYANMNDAKERRIYQWYLDNKDIIFWFKKLYGEIKSLSQHAGGIVITPEPIYNYIPIHRSKNVMITGFPEADKHKVLSSGIGLLKIDVLGLKTVTIIKKTIELIKQKRNIDITKEVYEIDLNNQELYDEFAKGENNLIFQFESEGINQLIKKSNPRNIQDVSAINSLYRPGAVLNADTFADNCSGREEPQSIHPLVDEILKPTRYTLCYQEQISRIINACTGISIGKCEKIRKAITDLDGKKYPEMAEEYNSTFIDLCIQNGIEKEKAEYIKEYLDRNSGYLFNFSHSLSYSILAMQTLFLKLYYPAEFYAIELSSVKESAEFGLYIGDCIRKGILVEEPDILHSDLDFTTKDDKTIVCGLNILKGFGDKAYEELINSGRSFESIIDFLMHPWSKLNKKCLEGLYKTGVFKSLESNTKIVKELIEYHLENKKNLNKEIKKGDDKGQLKYCREHLEKRYEDLKKGDMKDFTESEYSNLWISATGFSNPFKNKFSKYLGTLSSYGVVAISSWKDDFPFVYGEIVNREELYTVNDKPYVRLKMNDGFSNKTVVIWGNQIDRNNELNNGLKIGNLVCMELDKDNYGFKYKNNGKFIVID